MLFYILFQNIFSLYITGILYIVYLSRFSSKHTFITFFFKTHICHMLFYTKCIFKWAMMRFRNSNSDILKILSLISLFILHCLVLVFANILGVNRNFHPLLSVPDYINTVSFGSTWKTRGFYSNLGFDSAISTLTNPEIYSINHTNFNLS